MKVLYEKIKTKVFLLFAELQISDIQEMLGDAVNNLVKHFYKPEKEVRFLPSLSSAIAWKLHKFSLKN